MSLDSIYEELDLLLGDDTLLLDEKLEERVEALSFLEFAAGALRAHRRYAVDEQAEVAARTRLTQIRELEDGLRAANRQVFGRIRRQILAGAALEPADNARTRLRDALDRFTHYRAGQAGTVHAGFDGLDALASGVFLEEPLPDHGCDLDEEMISFQATPVSAILELVDRIPFGADDVFCDLGSGPGLVAMLVNLLTGVRAYGVEIDPALCDYAQRCAARFALAGVSFVRGDARDVDLHASSVFYLFTPFTGTILRRVLERLREEARTRAIRVCSYGPSTPVIARELWLVPLDVNGDDEFKLACFESVRIEP